MGHEFCSLGLSEVGDSSLRELDGNFKDERGDIPGEKVRRDVERKAYGVSGRLSATLEHTRRAIRCYYY